MPSPSSRPPPVALDQALNTAQVERVVFEHLAPRLEGYLYEQRWFGDKDRPPAGLSVVDVAVDRVESGWFVLAIANVRFGDGSDPADYLLLAAVIPDASGTGATLVRLTTPDGDWQVADIAAAPSFPAWWLSKFAGGQELAGAQGEYAWGQFAGFRDAAVEAGPGNLIVGGLGQSNTTVRYADAMFGKIFRRLRPGINPDEEISRTLAEQTSFRQLPIPYGSALYRSASGTAYPVGVLFSFVPSVGEGWEWTQRFLTQDPLPSYAAAARGLGERTGQLHLALASVTADPAFAPEPVTANDIATWQRETTAAVSIIAGDLAARLPTLPPTMQQVVTAALAQWDRLRERVGGFAALAGTVKTRIHGDYHLGQVLRTPDEDWVLLDFEGEPARTIEQRRAKMAPMKDVADMLRSFGNARGLAARSPAADQERLRAWEQEARQAFLTGYRAAVAAAPTPLVPGDDAAFTEAVAAWELAKAMYEVRYELGNRPDWLDVPLSTLIAGD